MGCRINIKNYELGMKDPFEPDVLGDELKTYN